MGYKSDLFGAFADATLSCFNLVETFRNPKRPFEILNEGLAHAVENEKQRELDSKYYAKQASSFIHDVLPRALKASDVDPVHINKFRIEEKSEHSSADLYYLDRFVTNLKKIDENYYLLTSKRGQKAYNYPSQTADNLVFLINDALRHNIEVSISFEKEKFVKETGKALAYGILAATFLSIPFCSDDADKDSDQSTDRPDHEITEPALERADISEEPLYYDPAQDDQKSDPLEPQ